MATEAEVMVMRAYRPLAQLTTGWAIADYLMQKGIKGKRCNANACPMANYFSIETRMDILSGIARIFPSSYGAHFSPRFTLLMTPAMQTFVRDFDHGHYSELLASDD